MSGHKFYFPYIVYIIYNIGTTGYQLDVAHPLASALSQETVQQVTSYCSHVVVVVDQSISFLNLFPPCLPLSSSFVGSSLPFLPLHPFLILPPLLPSKIKIFTQIKSFKSTFTPRKASEWQQIKNLNLMISKHSKGCSKPVQVGRWVGKGSHPLKQKA